MSVLFVNEKGSQLAEMILGKEPHSMDVVLGADGTDSVFEKEHRIENVAQTSWRCVLLGFVGYAFAIFNITNFSQAGYEDVAHRDVVRPQPTQGEVNGTEESEAVKEKSVEELEKDVEEHENKLRDIELEIEAEDAVIPRGFAMTYTPTEEEYDRHCLTYLPYRYGSPICIQAKKKNIAHTKTKSDRGVLVLASTI